VLAEVNLAASSTLPLLLLGEPGTGKNLLAQRVHELSGRSGPFVAVNCGAIPAELVESYLFGHRKGAFTGATADAVGFFEKASGGTLFLDEVGALGLAQQPKLLQVLESQTFSPVGSSIARTTDARIVAATNADIRTAVSTGTFRHDLFTRLSGFEITSPPLRERRSDIPLLIRHFLSEFAPGRTAEWTAGSLEELLLYPWPGNVRELRFLVQRLALHQDASNLATRQLATLLPPVSSPAATSAPRRARQKPAGGSKSKLAVYGSGSTPAVRPTQQELTAQLSRLEGNVTKLAAHYGKDPKQIYRWMDAYGIDPGDFRTK
jgi:transcriptional regulator with GAF, ATPase, and Fis domain